MARASLEELRLDYEDFLRQRGLALYPANHPALKRFKAMRAATLEDVRRWVAEELGALEPRRTRTNTDAHKSVEVGESPCQSVPKPAELAANAALSLLNLACHLLDRQLAMQAEAFEQEGGFTERLHRVRIQRRG